MITKKLEKVYEMLEDELSKKIFAAKVKNYFLGGEDESISILYDYYPKSRIIGLEEFPENVEYVVTGAGKRGKKTMKALLHAGYNIRCVLDNDVDKQGEFVFEGTEYRIYSFSEFAYNSELNQNTVVIVDNKDFGDIFFNELCTFGVAQRQIYRTDDIVRTAFGNIYFDLPDLKCGTEEVFIDAGSFDGETTKDFIRHVNGAYKKIYACEPMTDGYNILKSNLAGIECVQICKVALSSKCGKANFSQTYAGLMGSKLGEHGDHIEEVELDTIDHMLEGQEATFIKMDIEGAELDALKGAEYTLRKYKPKLAISLYHKNEDLYEIPLWIKSIVPEYKFYLRHYSNKRWDLVLYCVKK